MQPCCPPGHGCNAPDGAEPCVLALCRREADAEPSVARALARYSAWQLARQRDCGRRERRFRRRAYERARDRALATLLMRAERSRDEQRVC
jgi:hypothetical protein